MIDGRQVENKQRVKTSLVDANLNIRAIWIDLKLAENELFSARYCPTSATSREDCMLNRQRHDELSNQQRSIQAELASRYGLNLVFDNNGRLQFESGIFR